MSVAQQQKFRLPPYPTTTIGSFPQTTQIRKARRDHAASAFCGFCLLIWMGTRAEGHPIPPGGPAFQAARFAAPDPPPPDGQVLLFSSHLGWPGQNLPCINSSRGPNGGGSAQLFSSQPQGSRGIPATLGSTPGERA